MVKNVFLLILTMKVLRVKREDGEKVRKRLFEKSVFDKEHQIESDSKFIYFPVTVSKGFEKYGDFVNKKLKKRSTQTKKPAYKGVFKRSHDLIGDIVVLESDDLDMAKKAAPDYLEFYKSAKTVVVKDTKTEGEFRIRKVKHVAGEKKFVTLHRENGCGFVVDLNKVFYTPRLSGERVRILSLVKNGEVVIDLFAGVGPYIIPIAKNRKVEAYAVDKNPHAYKLLLRNVGLNKVDVKCFLSDAREVKLPKADRIIMNLPKSSEDFLIAAMKLCKKGTIVHFYHFSPEEDLFKSHKEIIKKIAKNISFKVKFLREAKAGEIGIRQFRVVIDFRIY